MKLLSFLILLGQGTQNRACVFCILGSSGMEKVRNEEDPQLYLQKCKNKWNVGTEEDFFDHPELCLI